MPSPSATRSSRCRPRLRTTTTAPTIGRYLAIGDSVMLGAASPLRAAGFTVDAVESRQFGDYREAGSTDQPPGDPSEA